MKPPTTPRSHRLLAALAAAWVAIALAIGGVTADERASAPGSIGIRGTTSIGQ